MTFTPRQIVRDDFLQALIEKGLIDRPAAERVRSASSLTGTSIERSILELGLVEENAVYEALATHLGLDYVRPDDFEITSTKGLGLDRAFLDRVQVVPVRRTDDGILLAFADPGAGSVLQSIGFHLSESVSPAIASPSTIAEGLARLSPLEQDAAGAADSDVARLKALANDGPIIKLVNEIVSRAAAARASDIHIEAGESGARIRYRIDGVLGVDSIIPDDRRAAVISRLKVMADLNISEKRRPQDGRMTLAVRGRNIDVRVSTLPTQFGESVVLRLLDQSRVDLDWDALGFSANLVAQIRALLTSPNGIFLVAGPTGSGKTTTLYTALRELNNDDRKIVTVEDPIEYSLGGINQTQVDTAIDMTFARALRAILRQDPDIVMVGEIRDRETAEIAVRAALIGRLVLSTIHTNDSISAVTRLVDLGVPPFLLAGTLRGVLSQRLVRRLCEACRGSGCASCQSSGHAGRQVISELLTVTPRFAEAISENPNRHHLEIAAEGDSFTPIRDDADRLVSAGRVSEPDVERALGLSILG